MGSSLVETEKSDLPEEEEKLTKLLSRLDIGQDDIQKQE